MLKDSLSIDRIKETQYTGGKICLTSCGSYLFCINGSNVNIIELSTGITLLTLESDEEEVTCIAISPNDKHLITAHRNLLLKQWDIWQDLSIKNDQPNEIKARTTSKFTRAWKAIHSAPIQFMCFDITSTLLATGSSDNTTKVWDIQAQYCTHNLKGAQGVITLCQFHPLIEKFQFCVTGSEDGKIRLYNLNTSKLEACLEGHFSSITCGQYINYTEEDQEFNQFLSTSRDKVVIIWDLKKLVKLCTMPVYESVESFLMVRQFLDSEKFDRYFLTMGNCGVLKLWDAKTSKCLFEQTKNESPKIHSRDQTAEDLDQCIIQSVFVKSKSLLVLVTIDQLIVFVQLNPKNIERLLNGETCDKEPFYVSKQFIGDHGEILDAQMLNVNDNLLVLATNSEFVKVYDLNTWDCKLLNGHKDLVISLSVYNGRLKPVKNQAGESFDIDIFASSSKDSTIRLWKVTRDPRTNQSRYECACEGIGHTQDIGSLAFSRCSFDYLVSGSMDTTIKLWRIKEKPSGFELNVEFTIKAHEKDINSLDVSPNDKLIVSGSSDKTAKIWSSVDGTCLAVLRGHKRGVWCVGFSTHDQLVVTSSADATIKLWALSDFICVKTFEGHNTSVLKVLFMNNGKQLLSSGSDGLLKIWNIKTSECMSTFDKHEEKAWALCMSRGQERVVSGGADGRLIVWKDITEKKREEELAERQNLVLKEQELSNFLKEKRWKKALDLAILLDKPFKCYEIIKEILQNTNEVVEERRKTTKGKVDLENTLLKLKDDQIKTLLKYSIDWNTNTKFCHLSQAMFELIVRNYSPEFLMKAGTSIEFGSILIDQFLPYTERHNVRLNRLSQQIMFIDYAWSNMKLQETGLGGN